MATQVVLKAGKRDLSGKGPARRARAAGNLPAVVYGGAEGPLHLVLNTHEAELLFRSISVDNTIINLEVEGESGPVATLIREIQTHPARSQLLHVDFLRIQTGVEVELDVPVQLEGVPDGVRLDHGILEQTVHHLPVRCIPSQIPESIRIDVTGLRVGDSMHVAQLTLPPGVTVLTEQDQTICSVQYPSGGEPKAAEAEAEG